MRWTGTDWVNLDQYTTIQSWDKHERTDKDNRWDETEKVVLKNVQDLQHWVA